MKHSLFPAALLLLAMVSTAQASTLVYTPVNPSFGGNPLNGSNLLNEANAGNKYTAPVTPLSTAQQLANFNTALQNAVISRITSAALQNIVSVDGKLIPGTVETQNFIISVVDSSSGLVTITTTDKATGAMTSFTLDQTPPSGSSP